MREADITIRLTDERSIRLTVAEALVLDEFLGRYSDKDQLNIVDQAEQQALWNLQCLLERVVLHAYPWPTLEEARSALRDPVE